MAAPLLGGPHRFRTKVTHGPPLFPPAMTAIWSAENRYRIWWAIEVFAAEAMGKIGMIPAEDAATIRKAYDADVLGEIDVPAIDAIEAVTKHDVIAFLTWAGEKLGPERRWLHQGMTSSDVLDTSLAVQLKQSADLLLEDLDAAARSAEAPRL